MLTTDSSRFRRRACWLLVPLWGWSAGCETTDPPAMDWGPTSMADAASSAMPGAPTDAGPLDAGALDPGASEAGPWSPAASDAAALDAAASDAGPKDAGQAPLPDAATSNRDSSTASADAAPGQPDAMGSAHVFSVDSKAEWTASGFKVEAGKCYSVHAKIDDQWLDSDVEANLEGWADQSNILIGLFADFRRVQQDDIGFYQFATCVDRNLDQCFPIGESSNICPRASGELFFFVNDAPGFEDNNVGTATVTIQAK